MTLDVEVVVDGGMGGEEALILVALRRGRGLADDTLLGILSHIALSLGLVAIAFLETLRVDLVSYSVWRHSRSFLGRHHLDLRWRRTGAGRVNCFLWRDLIALAMKVVGILLVTSLLIIPAATARRFARSPDQMAALAAVVGAIAVVAGLAGALHWDLLSAPTIVAAALCALASVLPERLHGARSVD